MPKAFVILFLIMSLNFSPALSQQPNDHKYKEVTALAGEFVDCLSDEEFLDAVVYFDDSMKIFMSAEKLAEIWNTTIIQLGPFKTKKRIRVERVEEYDYDIVFVTCQFKNVTLDIKLIFNADKRITNMFFVPSGPNA